MTLAWRVYVARDHPEGDTGLVSLGLHADTGSVRLACPAVRRQARVRANDADVIAQHRARADRRPHAPVPPTVAPIYRRRRLGTSVTVPFLSDRIDLSDPLAYFGDLVLYRRYNVYPIIRLPIDRLTVTRFRHFIYAHLLAKSESEIGKTSFGNVEEK